MIVEKKTAEKTSTDATRVRIPDRDNALVHHHQELEQRFAALVENAEANDALELRAVWASFERDLTRHLELEERELLPAFARGQPAEAGRLLAEHADIRRRLLDLSMRLDLHFLRADAVQEFVARLRDHARRESALLYPWAEREGGDDAWSKIEGEVGSAVDARAR